MLKTVIPWIFNYIEEGGSLLDIDSVTIWVPGGQIPNICTLASELVALGEIETTDIPLSIAPQESEFPEVIVFINE